ncbi:hypothetical protein OG21DRAFT_1506589 [Imleria badia]|nr:hypothetical protein OG21DRAFT_1506589 [Imleria badia]
MPQAAEVKEMRPSSFARLQAVTDQSPDTDEVVVSVNVYDFRLEFQCLAMHEEDSISNLDETAVEAIGIDILDVVIDGGDHNGLVR